MEKLNVRNTSQSREAPLQLEDINGMNEQSLQKYQKTEESKNILDKTQLTNGCDNLDYDLRAQSSENLQSILTLIENNFKGLVLREKTSNGYSKKACNSQFKTLDEQKVIN